MNALFVSQSGCLLLLLLAAALALIGSVEYWKIKDRRAAFLSWIWGGLIAIPWLICAISNNRAELIVVVILVAVFFVRWWQAHQKPKRER